MKKKIKRSSLCRIGFFVNDGCKALNPQDKSDDGEGLGLCNWCRSHNIEIEINSRSLFYIIKHGIKLEN
jgi:hypothetical protein